MILQAHGQIEPSDFRSVTRILQDKIAAEDLKSNNGGRTREMVQKEGEGRDERSRKRRDAKRVGSGEERRGGGLSGGKG